MVLRTMFGRLRNRFKFFVERMLLRGAHYRLLVIAALVGLVAAMGGMLVLEVEGGIRRPGRGDLVGFLAIDRPGLFRRR